MTCPVSGCDRRRHDDWTICRHHAWQLGRDLARAPALGEELELTLSRQRATANGTVGRSADEPLPFDAQASRALQNLRHTLTTWSCEVGIIVNPTDTTQAIAQHLTDRHHRLIVRIDAHTAVQQIADVCREGWRRVQPSSRGHIPLPNPCPDCGARMWATMHDVGDPRPNLVWCEGADPTAPQHEWRPEQWLRLGHRLGYGRTA